MKWQASQANHWQREEVVERENSQKSFLRNNRRTTSDFRITKIIRFLPSEGKNITEINSCSFLWMCGLEKGTCKKYLTALPIHCNKTTERLTLLGSVYLRVLWVNYLMAIFLCLILPTICYAIWLLNQNACCIHVTRANKYDLILHTKQNYCNKSDICQQVKLMDVYQMVCGCLTLLLLRFSTCSGSKICRCAKICGCPRTPAGSQRSSEITTCSDIPARPMNVWIQLPHFPRGYTLPRLVLLGSQNQNQQEIHQTDRTDPDWQTYINYTDKFWIGDTLTQVQFQDELRPRAQTRTTLSNKWGHSI